MIYITRKIPEPALNYLQTQAECRFWDEENTPVPREILLKEVAGVTGLYCLLTDRIDREVIDAAPYLKVISTMSVGVDHIDVEYARNKGILVTNTPGVLTETTADLAFGLLIAASRRFFEASNAVHKGEWKTWSPLFMAGQDIHGSSLGIVGMGRIGMAMARRARGFDMKVYYFSRKRRADLEQMEGIIYLPLDDLLRNCDYISLHVPLTPETVRLIGARELDLMKPTAVLINTARGAVVDELSLYRALKLKKIYAAGLDVFDFEPIDNSNPLLKLPNVMVLPHIGSASLRTRNKMAQMAAEDLILAVIGKLPRFLVTF